jgi:hypothetical protein
VVGAGLGGVTARQDCEGSRPTRVGQASDQASDVVGQAGAGSSRALRGKGTSCDGQLRVGHSRCQRQPAMPGRDQGNWFHPRGWPVTIRATLPANTNPVRSPSGHRRQHHSSEPLGSDGVWTKRGPGMPARGGSGAPPGKPCSARETPAGCPRQASPAWAITLFRGSPGGVWARDIPLYRRAVPDQRHGGTPASCWFKPCPLRWLAWTTRHQSADEGNPPFEYQPSMIGRRLDLHFTLEVQRFGQGLCPTLLRLPGPWCSTCRALASHASQADGHWCGHQEAGRHAHRPCRPGREHRHPG